MEEIEIKKIKKIGLRKWLKQKFRELDNIKGKMDRNSIIYLIIKNTIYFFKNEKENSDVKKLFSNLNLRKIILLRIIDFMEDLKDENIGDFSLNHYVNCFIELYDMNIDITIFPELRYLYENIEKYVDKTSEIKIIEKKVYEYPVL